MRVDPQSFLAQTRLKLRALLHLLPQRDANGREIPAKTLRIVEFAGEKKGRTFQRRTVGRGGAGASGMHRP